MKKILVFIFLIFTLPIMLWSQSSKLEILEFATDDSCLYPSFVNPIYINKAYCGTVRIETEDNISLRYSDKDSCKMELRLSAFNKSVKFLIYQGNEMIDSFRVKSKISKVSLVFMGKDSINLNELNQDDSLIYSISKDALLGIDSLTVTYGVPFLPYVKMRRYSMIVVSNNEVYEFNVPNALIPDEAHVLFKSLEKGDELIFYGLVGGFDNSLRHLSGLTLIIR